MLSTYTESLTNLYIDDYIFKSRKGNCPITVKALHRIITETCKELGVKGNYGTHIKENRGYFIYINNVAENPTIIAYLQRILNYSSQETTLRYIGIEDEEIDDIIEGLKLF